jgi:ABC-type arginine transport system permease subunit
VYFGWKVLLTHFMLYLWNLGVSSLIVLAFANWNYKYIDLKKGASFNWQGTGATQFLMGIPMTLIPLIIYASLSALLNPLAGTLALGFLGLLFIITRQFWLNLLVKTFLNKRHLIAEGFREH